MRLRIWLARLRSGIARRNVPEENVHEEHVLIAVFLYVTVRCLKSQHVSKPLDDRFTTSDLSSQVLRETSRSINAFTSDENQIVSTPRRLVALI